MRADWMRSYLPVSFSGLPDEALPESIPVTHGKVREIVDLGDELLITSSDRVSAFDRVLALVPCKGELLNRMSLYWFSQTRDIVANHIVEMVTPRTTRVKKCRMIPIEVVVRGYLSGSAWRDYREGKPVSGVRLAEGLSKNERLPEPLVTPSTKETEGHDRPVSEREIIESGVVEQALWQQIRETALALYERGSALSAEAGLILVDTKYEFGLDADGTLTLIDELHTPDSSRYWKADDYERQFSAGQEQYHLDKEFLRAWLLGKGYSGEGTPPEIPEDVVIELAGRYIEAVERLTGAEFEPMAQDPDREVDRVIDLYSRAGNTR
ncbi:MAG: phosphoribosylaminoimidazolesuccinocarboxamide synthase [Spirochaetales bacterium]